MFLEDRNLFFQKYLKKFDSNLKNNEQGTYNLFRNKIIFNSYITYRLSY